MPNVEARPDDEERPGPVTDRQELLVQALRDPEATRAWGGRHWSLALRQARFTGLAGRLAHQILRAAPGAPLPCPPPMRAHLESALRVSRAQRDEVLREARNIDQALGSLGAPVILLKGAAYAVAGLPPAHGRVFSDVDILVPKSHLAKAESLLTMHGWMSTETSDYNQHYYREWMHELPPMRHLQRGTVLDLHHTILPETARLRPDAAKLVAAAQRLPQTQSLHILAPVDMLLHSLTHLFLNDDVTHALRDLSDLDLLLRQYPTSDAIWSQLPSRAVELNLERPLHYALGHLSKVLSTPIPTECKQAAARHAPGPMIDGLMNSIWAQALTAPVSPDEGLARTMALQALYLRGHWLRMPPLMLARHLSIKALGLHKRPQARSGGSTKNGAGTG